MARFVYQPGPTLSASPIKRWVPTMSLWAFGAGTAAIFVSHSVPSFITLFLSTTPKVKNTFLIKVPVLGSYFEDKTPAEDKPF